MGLGALPPVVLGIRLKLVGLMVASSFLVACVLASYFPARHIAELRAGLRERAEAYARVASLQLRSAIAFNDKQTARDVLGAIAKDPLVDGVALYTESGERLGAAGQLSELGDSARQGFGTLRSFSLPGRVLAAVPVASLEGPHGTLVLELSTKSAIAARNQLIRVALGVGLGVLLVSALFAWRIARSLAYRVERVAAAAAGVAQGDLDLRLELGGPRDEIGLLAHSFDAMVRRLKGLVQHINDTARAENERLEIVVTQRTAELGRRNADLRLVMDNVEQGFVTIDREARIVGEHSRAIELWLGALPVGSCLWDCFESANPGSRSSFEVGWSQLIECVMPAEVSLSQMPQELLVGNRYLRFEYRPLGHEEEFEWLLIVVSDATALVERDRTEQEERDIIQVSSRLLNDRAGFMDFLREAEVLLERLRESDGDLQLYKRALHTLKGNTALFGMASVSKACHEAEISLELHGLTSAGHATIAERWAHILGKIRPLLGGKAKHALEIDEGEFRALVREARRGGNLALLRMLEAWQLEPLRARLERASEQLVATALRFGKGDVRVAVVPTHVYLDRGELSEFWVSFAHVVRNAVSHGLEVTEEREERGKNGAAQFALRGGVERGVLFVELQDYGPGVDWAAVRERALQAGMRADTAADLEQALFADGFSTETEQSEISGRGVGLSAVKAACEAREGKVEIVTQRGRGTTFRFSWPTRKFSSLFEFDVEVAS